MKSFILKSIALSFIALSLWSCTKEETRAVATDGKGATLKASVNTVVINRSILTADVISLTMTEADFGYNAAITNVLQISVKGANFEASRTKEVILDAKTLQKVYKGLDFNNLLLSLNLSTTANTDVELRIKSYISLNVAPVFSNVVTISARPFPLTAWVYVPGAYQGWNPSTADSLVSETGNGVYVGVIHFTPNNFGFKVTPVKNWNTAWGDAGSGRISTSGGDFNAGAAGSQQITINLNTNTYSMLPLAWAIIGDATPGGWGSDTFMKFVNDGNNLWTIRLNLSVGNFKFRRNSDWGVNLGGSGGNLTGGGADIPISTAGNYTITLNTITNKYTLVRN
jgi:hypothetical protein